MQLLTIYNQQLETYIHKDFALEVLDDDCAFSEGPVWNSEGYYLFSDIPSNIISKIVPGNAKEVFITGSGCKNPDEAELPRMMGSNGLAYYKNDLLICQHGEHGLARYDGKDLYPFVTTYHYKQLNSPNDIVVHANETVFFSDPPYGLKEQQLNPEKYQPVAGFYCWREGELKLFCDTYKYPNGVCLSPDGKHLYTCSNKPFEASIQEFDVNTLELKREVARENSDGIKCDLHGNLYLCNKDGIIILNQQGQRLGLIQLPTVPANCCWGGKELKDLFICARENIFLIRNLLK